MRIFCQGWNLQRNFWLCVHLLQPRDLKTGIERLRQTVSAVNMANANHFKGIWWFAHAVVDLESRVVEAWVSIVLDQRGAYWSRVKRRIPICLDSRKEIILFSEWVALVIFLYQDRRLLNLIQVFAPWGMPRVVHICEGPFVSNYADFFSRANPAIRRHRANIRPLGGTRLVSNQYYGLRMISFLPLFWNKSLWNESPSISSLVAVNACKSCTVSHRASRIIDLSPSYRFTTVYHFSLRRRLIVTVRVSDQARGVRILLAGLSYQTKNVRARRLNWLVGENPWTVRVGWNDFRAEPWGTLYLPYRRQNSWVMDLELLP